MDKARRKQAVADYKERAKQAGVFALTCGPSQRVWVGTTRDMDKIKNRISFSLQSGGFAHADLLGDIKTYGPASFEYEELARLDAALSEIEIEGELKRQAQAFCRERGAERI